MADIVLKDDKEVFAQEQTELLRFVLSERYFKLWKEAARIRNTDKWDQFYEEGIWKASYLELYLTSKCNQKCEYCYLHKYPLYPEEYDKKEIILENLEKIYQWIITENFYIPKIEFFTGEIWHNDFGYKVLEITLEYIEKGLQAGWFIIPSNCSFCLDNKKMERIQYYIDRFNEYNIPLVFSISIDGAPVENEMRPLNDGSIKQEDFYSNVFTFAKHNNFYFHPMVAAKDSDKWVENYKWWKQQCEEYDLDIGNIMMLEVRNDDWTQRNIDNYKKLLDFWLEEAFEYCGRDPYAFSRYYVNAYGEGGHGYIPWSLTQADTFTGCSVSDSLTLRVGDLAICPCHRTAYNKYLYGYLKTNEQGYICDLVANNPQMAITILFSNQKKSTFKCDTCIFNEFCLKGCYGTQIEIHSDPFIQINSVCNFFKQKIEHILSKLEEYGIMDEFRKVTLYDEQYNRVQKILRLEQEVKAQNGMGKFTPNVQINVTYN